jgi:hypothetical protein
VLDRGLAYAPGGLTTIGEQHGLTHLRISRSVTLPQDHEVVDVALGYAGLSGPRATFTKFAAYQKRERLVRSP